METMQVAEAVANIVRRQRVYAIAVKERIAAKDAEEAAWKALGDAQVEGARVLRHKGITMPDQVAKLFEEADAVEPFLAINRNDRRFSGGS